MSMGTVGPDKVESHILRPEVSGPSPITFGGISSDGLYGWIAVKNELHMYNLTTYKRMFSWSFPSSQDGEITIQTCISTTVDGAKTLIIGVTKSIFFVTFNGDNSSRITEVFLPTGVSPNSLCVFDYILPNGSILPSSEMSSSMSRSIPLVAVGTDSGQVFLLNARDVPGGKKVRMKKTPSSDSGLSSLLYSLKDGNEQLYFDLTSSLHKREGQFEHPAFREGETDDILIDHGEDTGAGIGISRKSNFLNANQASVTCLHYIPETAMLAIGFEFGSFQLWSLVDTTPTLCFASPILSSFVPITHITSHSLEKSKITKNMVYLWTCTGTRDGSKSDPSTPYPLSICLWRVSFLPPLSKFNKIEKLHERHLGGTKDRRTYGRMVYQAPIQSTTQVEVRYVLFVWETIESQSKYHKHKNYVVGQTTMGDPKGYSNGICMELFDMKRAVGGLPNFVSAIESCSYYEPFQIQNNIQPRSPFLAFSVDMCSVDQLVIPKLLIKDNSDPLFGKLSVSFNTWVLTCTECISMRFSSPQSKNLQKLCQQGPWAFDQNNLRRTYQSIKEVGLFLDSSGSDDSNMPDEEMQQNLFDVCLHFNCVSLLCDYVTATGDLEGVSEIEVDEGCYLLRNPAIILNWVWKTFKELEDCAEKYIEDLKINLTHLSQKCILLNNINEILVRLLDLQTVMEALLNRDNTPDGRKRLLQNSHHIRRYVQYLDVFIFFFERPQQVRTYHVNFGDISKDVQKKREERIKAAYNGRQSLTSSPTQSDKHSKLLIDLCLENLQLSTNDSIQDSRYPIQFTYPPKDFMQLLLLYQNGDPESILKKKSIILYTLIESYSIVKLISKNESFGNLKILENEPIATFCRRFAIPVEQQNLMYGFWLLDKQQWQLALGYLVDARLDSFSKEWGSIVLRIFYDFESYNCALKFIQIKRPPLPTRNDVIMQLKVLLHCGQFLEALNFLRKWSHSSPSNDANNDYQDLLFHHIFSFCETSTDDSMIHLFQLPLNAFEEERLIEYLKSDDMTTLPRGDLLVIYYLQRGRYTEAIQYHEKLLENDEDPDRARTRSNLIENYKLTLPPVQLENMFSNMNVDRDQDRTGHRLASVSSLSSYPHQKELTPAQLRLYTPHGDPSATQTPSGMAFTKSGTPNTPLWSPISTTTSRPTMSVGPTPTVRTTPISTTMTRPTRPSTIGPGYGGLTTGWSSATL